MNTHCMNSEALAKSSVATTSLGEEKENEPKCSGHFTQKFRPAFHSKKVFFRKKKLHTLCISHILMHK